LLKAHFQNPYFLGLKALLNQMCSKGLKKTFISSNPFAFLIINVQILSSFQKEWCAFGRK
jgi:hypothetical protein